MPSEPTARAPRVEIVLSGRFRVTGSDGIDRTPRSEKACGCLALLATAPRLDRSRTWLADKLWSDKPSHHALGSLRTALKKIREALGPDIGALQVGQRVASLDPARVRIIRHGGEEFLEGIDIPDPEWNDWLRGERLRDAAADMPQTSESAAETATDSAPEAAPAVATGRGVPSKLTLIPAAGDTGAERFVNGAVLEMLARNMAEITGYDALFHDDDGDVLRMRVASSLAEPGKLVRMSLQKGIRRRHLWSEGRMLSGGGASVMEDLDLYALVFEAQEAVVKGHLDDLPRRHLEADARTATQIAVRKVMSFDHKNLADAVRRLTEIAEAEDCAPAFGWLIFALRAQYYETAPTRVPLDYDLLNRACARALDLGSLNSFVLASVSAAYLRLLDRRDEGLELARRAVRLNPSNPFAVDAMASAMYLGDRQDEGYKLARTAARLVRRTQFAPFFEMSQCVGATLASRFSEARSLAVSASAVAPRLRSAWRFRLALAAHSGALDEARHCRSVLERSETGFSTRRLIEDPDYPVPTLRVSQLELGRLQGL